MKALEFLKQERAHHLAVHNDKSILDQYDEAIEELEELQKEKDLLEEYVHNLQDFILKLIDVAVAL